VTASVGDCKIERGTCGNDKVGPMHRDIMHIEEYPGSFPPYLHIPYIPGAKFIVPDWGDKVNSGDIGWGAGTTTLCRSQLYPPVRDYEFGYRMTFDPYFRPFEYHCGNKL
jgi:hypothetical protein